MGVFGGYYKGERKKKKKEELEKKADHIAKKYEPPRVEIIGKKGKS